MADLARVEFWSNLEAAGGIRRALVTDLLRCEEVVALDGEDTLTLQLQRDNPALVTIETTVGETNAEPSAVVRCAFTDGLVVDRRVARLEEQDAQGQTTIALTARGMMHELSLRGMIARTSSNDGSRTYKFAAIGLTPSQQIAQYVLPALVEAGQTFWEAGTIHADTPVTVIYERDTPLGALRKIAAATAAGLEVGVRYDAARKKFLLDLVRRIGASAAAVRVHAGVNLVQLSMGRSADDLATRIYAFGAEDDELGVATMGKNAWLLSQMQSSGGNIWTAQLVDPAGGPGPVQITGQFNPTSEGTYWLVPVGRPELTSFTISASDGDTGTLTLLRFDTALGLPGSGTALYSIRRGWNDALLHGSRTRESPYVEDPPSVAAHGARVAYVDRADVIGVVNQLRNPLARLWGDGSVNNPANLPVNWTLANGTGSKETSQWRSGGASLRVQFASSDGLLTIFGYQIQSTSGWLSFYADVQAVTGVLAVKLLVTLPNPKTLPDGSVHSVITYPDDMQRLNPALPYLPTLETRSPGAWERLGVERVHDALTYPVIGIRVVVVPAVGTPNAVGLVDAAQVTGTATQRELVEGSGSNVLMQAANSNLLRYAGLSRSLDVDVLDLTTMDDQRFPYDQYVLGGQIVVRDERLGKTATARVMGWTRDWLNKQALRVQISNAGATLADMLAQRTPSTRPLQVIGGLK